MASCLFAWLGLFLPMAAPDPVPPPAAFWDLQASADDVQEPHARVAQQVGSPEKTAEGIRFRADAPDGLLYARGPGNKLCVSGSFSLWVRAAFGPAQSRVLSNHDTLVSRWGPGIYSFLLKADAFTGTLHLCLSQHGRDIVGFDSGYAVDRSGAFHDLGVIVRAGEDVTFYVDGRRHCVLKDPVPPRKIFDPPGEAAPFAIGYNHDPAPARDHETMNGTIAAVRLWRGAVPPAAMARLSRLDPREAREVTCRIEVDASKTLGRVHPYVFGQFLEHYENIVYDGIYPGDPRLRGPDGFRKEVIEALRRLRPTVIRWPGGNFTSGYHWRLGAGPVRGRQVVGKEPVWNKPEPNSFGTSEFIRLCRRVGAEPLICVGVGRDARCPTPDEAASWVRYCNTTEGPEAELRREAGDSEPYNVKLWGLGNEVYGNWQLGYYRDPRQYAGDLVRYANAMRAVDPSLRFVVCGDSYKPDNMPWNRQVLSDAVVPLADWISYHSYTHLGPFGPRLSHEAASRRLAQIQADLDAVATLNRATSRPAAPGRVVQTAVDEWNEFSWGDAAENQRPATYDLAHALFTAGFLHALLRHADQVTLATYSPAVNCRGLIAAEARGVLLRSSFYVLEMYRSCAGCEVLAVKTEVPTLTGSAAPALDAVAVRTPGGELMLFVINREPQRAIRCDLNFKGFEAADSTAKLLTGPALTAYNDFGRPREVSTREVKIDMKGSAPVVEFPPRSVMQLTLKPVTGGKG